jgi:hypothetical protein
VLVFFFAHSFLLHIVAPICSIVAGIVALRGYAQINVRMFDSNGERIDVTENILLAGFIVIILGMLVHEKLTAKNDSGARKVRSRVACHRGHVG